jgi:Ca2+-binding EF-hand superfamily protein
MYRPLILVPALLLATAAQAQAQAQPAAAAAPAVARTQFIADMDTQFRKMDADKNGQLNRTEIEQFQRLTAVAESRARNQALFRQLDRDRNSYIDANEFAAATPAPTTVNGMAVIARMDSDQNQAVSMVEHRTATLANFDRLDTDKDGTVTAAEMRAGGIGQ